MELENVLPSDIEKRSMELIAQEIGDTSHLSESEVLVVKRVIHTTADFDFLSNLKFSANAVEQGMEALRGGAVIITDTHMAEAGISKPATKQMGCQLCCFMSDEEVALRAKQNGTTRAVASMDKAAELFGQVPTIFAIGNAPTALIRICELIREQKLRPALVIGAPVGFVNILPSKEMLMESGVPYIVADGRKGGSNVAAAICNAMLYQIYDRTKAAVKD